LQSSRELKPKVKTITYTDTEVAIITEMADFCRKHVPIEQVENVLTVYFKTKNAPVDPEPVKTAND